MTFPSDSVDALIARQLPAWLTSAQPEHLRKLHRALSQQQECAEQLKRIFARLPALDQFAMPLLDQALRDIGVEVPDVRRMQVRITQELALSTAAPRLPVPTQTFRSRQSLLAAALHNFHADDTQPMLRRQAILVDAQGQPLSLDFQSFARCCRQLDLGGRYQTLIGQVLQPKDRPGSPKGMAGASIERLMETNLRLQLEAAVRLAALKGVLSHATYLQLLPLIAAAPTVPALPGRVTAYHLNLLGKPIVGALALGIHAAQADTPSCIVLWLPQDPLATLSQHASWEDLQAALVQRLRGSGYRRYFARFVRERDRPAFDLNLGVQLGVERAELDIRHFAIESEVFACLRSRQIDKLLDDAGMLAVPTAQEDLLERHLRLQAMAGAGLDLLNLAALFVPVLGEVMLAVAAVQVADEVYEGYRDWQLGDRQGALDHAFGVALGVSESLLLGGAMVAGKAVLKRIEFVDELVPELRGASRLRLAQGETLVHDLRDHGPLLRQWDGALADDSDGTAEVLLQSTGMRLDQLRRLHLEGAPAPARLLDLRDRYLALRENPALQAHALDLHLANLQGAPSAEQAVLLRDFPGLSVRGAAEILEQASTAQRDSLLDNARVPLALAERARWYVRDSRLDRACLGLHMAEASNADTARLALGLTGPTAPLPEAGEQMRIWQANHASEHREQAAALLGMAPVGAGIRPPRRFADGRLGYPLSGRAGSSRQAIRRGIQQIFPTLQDTELEVYMLDLMGRDVNLWDHYQQLQTQLSSLRAALDSWQEQGRGLRQMLRRRRVAEALRRCWRRKVVNLADEYVLFIDGERTGELPALPEGVDYGHVRRMTLRGMDLSTLGSDFLNRFGNLVELDLRGNQLTAIPPGLENLSQLRLLDLSSNRIVMDADGNRRLGALTHLQSLDLSFSQLGETPDVSSLIHLRHLHLRATALAELPAPNSLGWQSLADLRENHIRQIREHVDSLRLRVQRLHLHDNPLDEPSARRLDQARGNVHAATRGSAGYRHQSLDASVREIWIGSVRDDLRNDREALWDTLRGEPESADLFRFLADFAVSEDFQEHPGHYRMRIWRLLEACEQHESVRTALFREAGGPRTCDDRLLLMLSQMEISVLVQRGIDNVDVADLERRLVRLGTTLFRLDQVDQEAARHIVRLHERGVSGIDDIEVRLCYRVKLAPALELPAQPDTMHYESFAQVTSSDLKRALRAVQAAENAQAVSDSLAERPFWQNHVRDRESQRFEALVEGFQQRLVEAESAASTGGEQAYLEASNALMHELHAAERELIRTLAREAYERSQR
ncbi:NEL-type E3 ubiquitin ligase domain-containing protein [Pseudomonas sp. KU43P]|uniref:NEL-type E3 ubiquitin ligase domain-containing protein n=1 Tax=Pseudomonas sp. KU43P TaxID=2487887 RepID=UPI0012A7B72C|nr:NEL-type E3 ubiquitin ligase domain-containing protein [Pseudomonas sp. KU43P]BBH47753.1 hypothetical protein KU43P_42300 [Pseudomonas sp. KU43P]